MGAHNAATLLIAERRAEHVADVLRDMGKATAVGWADTIEDALTAPAGGTLKAWAQARDGQRAETFQATVWVADLHLSGVWLSGPRLMWARPTHVTFDGSTRSFAGVVTLRATDSAYIGFAPWGDDAVQMIVYKTAQ